MPPGKTKPFATTYQLPMLPSAQFVSGSIFDGNHHGSLPDGVGIVTKELR